MYLFHVDDVIDDICPDESESGSDPEPSRAEPSRAGPSEALLRRCIALASRLEGLSLLHSYSSVQRASEAAWPRVQHMQSGGPDAKTHTLTNVTRETVSVLRVPTRQAILLGQGRPRSHSSCSRLLVFEFRRRSICRPY